MKEIKVYHDNILIKLTTVKTSIVIPGADNGKPQSGMKTDSIEIVQMGETAQKALVGIEVGSKVLLDINPLQSHQPYNGMLGAKEKSDDVNNNTFYYFIKSFNIIAGVK